MIQPFIDVPRSINPSAPMHPPDWYTPLWQKWPDLVVTLIGVFVGAVLALGVQALFTWRGTVSRRRRVIAALRREITSTIEVIDSDLRELANQKIVEFFPWARLSTTMVQQALHEETFLKLRDPRPEQLQDLMRKLDRANTYVTSHFAAVSVTGAGSGIYVAVGIYNKATRERFVEVRQAAVGVLREWWNVTTPDVEVPSG